MASDNSIQPIAIPYKSRADRISFIIVIFTLAIGISFYFNNWLSNSRTPFAYNIIPLAAGLTFQCQLFSKRWLNTLLMLMAGFLLSLLVFMPWHKEVDYVLSKHTAAWPYTFILTFTLCIISVYERKIIPRLNEGILLLQSLAFIYWSLDTGLLAYSPWLFAGLMFIPCMFTLFAIYNAFSKSTLTDSTRLTLSIWSCIVMIVFATDNAVRIYLYEQTSQHVISEGIYMLLQFFLLGISSVYFAENTMLLLGFIKGKGSKEKYQQDLKEFRALHINRFSGQQAGIAASFVCFICLLLLFGSNYFYHFVSGNFMIWIGLVLFPYLINYFYGMVSKAN